MLGIALQMATASCEVRSYAASHECLAIMCILVPSYPSKQAWDQADLAVASGEATGDVAVRPLTRR